MSASGLTLLWQQFLRYTGAGAVGTVVHYAVLISLVNAGLQATLASTAGFVLAALINYWLNYHYTFGSSQAHHKALTKFFVISLIGLGINSAIMFVLVGLQWHYLLAQVMTLLPVLTWNFLANRYWTFGGENNRD